MTNTAYHKTAIHRSQPSAPASWIYNNTGIHPASTLDYGCGRGFDCDYFGFEGYEPNTPHYEHSHSIEGLTWDTILCTYVLNVIPSQADREAVIQDIKNHLKEDGVAYVTVRNDKSCLNGYTLTGSWQGFVELDYPIVHKTSSYIIYKILK